MMMKIALGSDHGGFQLKEAIKKHLEEKGYEVKDYGTYSEESCDYPKYGKAVADAIVSGECERGILCCGTGVGISLAANKVKGIRACVCSDTFTAKYTRLHNNANILSLGGRVVGVGLALELVDIFLTTEYEGGRHQRRLDQLAAIENEQ
jgi:ribose 5-phosphate isomerase B